MENNNNLNEIEKEKEKMKELTKIVFSFTKLENQTIHDFNLSNEIFNLKGVVVKTKNSDFLTLIKKHEKKFNCFKNKNPIQIYSKIFKKETEIEKEKLLKNLGKIIFFSYRKNLPLFTNSNNKKYTSDSGWGCMIRCGQMIMAKALYKYYKAFKIKTLEAIFETLEFFIDSPFDIKNMPDFFIPMMNKFYKENYDVNENKKLDIKIIYPPFCIKTICFLGELFGKNVGDWFSDVNMVNIFKLISNNFNFFPYLKIFTFQSYIVFSDILESCFELINDDDNNNDINKNNNNDINKNNNNNDINNKNNKNNNNININININNNDSNNNTNNNNDINNNTININNNNDNNNINNNNNEININKNIITKTKNPETNPKKEKFIFDPHSKEIFEFEGKKYRFKKQGLIFVSQRLGLEVVTSDYYESFKKLFNCKYNLGIIGGIKRKAFYFIGLNSKGELIYLDPHTTKSTITSLDEEKIFNNYLVKEINYLNIKKMSAAFTIGFLFRNMKEFKELKNWFDDYFNSNKKFHCISFMNNRKKIENNYEKMKNAVNMDSDDF